MKKLFTLLSMVLMAVGANAQTTIFDAADAAWGAATLTTGETTVGNVTWHGRGSAAIASGNKTFEDDVKWTARLKFGGSSTFKSGSLAGVLTFTPTKTGVLKVYCVGGGTGTRTTFISQSITSTNRDETTSIGKYESVDQAIGIAMATVEAGQMVYIWANNNVGIYGMTFEEVSLTPVDPVFSLTKTKINQYQTSQIIVGEKSGLDGITLSELTYDNTVISIDAKGTITAVGEGTTDITFNNAATDKYNASANNKLQISVANATLDEAVSVTASATWDWSKFGNTEIKLTEDTTPSKEDEFVLSNIVNYGFCESIGSDFGNAKQLTIKCEYPVRDGKYFQGPMVKFVSSVSGKLAVTYCNTGTRSAEADRRFLNVNGTNYGSGTMDTEMMTTSDIPIAAGEVTISGIFTDTSKGAQYLRISKIVFTATGTDIQNVKAAKTAQNGVSYNLAGQKVDGTYKGIVIKDGKKMIQK